MPEIQEYVDSVNEICAKLPKAQRLDAGETMVLARQLEHIEARVYRKKYPELKGSTLVPTSTEDGNAVEFTTYRLWDSYAIAKIISNWATDFTTVTATAQEFSAKFKSFGAGYEYSIQDMRNAAKAGVALSDELVMAARRAIEIGLEICYAFGVPEAKTFGLANHPNVTLATLTTGNWASSTGTQILDDLNFARNYTANNTLGIWETDTMVMDGPSYRYIAAKMLSTTNSSNVSVLEAFLKQNPGFTVSPWEQLNTADAVGTGPRMIVYKKDEECIQFRLGQAFETFPAQVVGLAVKVPCHARAAGVIVRHPKTITFFDNHA